MAEVVNVVLEGIDDEQARLMEEQVILIDRNDCVIGHDSKASAHHASNGLRLHRAFSVFLFDSEGKMLLQQRASVKVTFASYWTNACCSHPLYTENELAPNGDVLLGVRNAAVRKLSHELGIKPGVIKPEELLYITRIHYKAHSDGGEWGEHEIDYVFFLQKDIELTPSPNEVDAVKYVTPAELEEMFAESEAGMKGTKMTPWFSHIMRPAGYTWWERLKTNRLSECVDPDNIIRYGGV